MNRIMESIVLFVAIFLILLGVIFLIAAGTQNLITGAVLVADRGDAAALRLSQPEDRGGKADPGHPELQCQDGRFRADGPEGAEMPDLRRPAVGEEPEGGGGRRGHGLPLLQHGDHPWRNLLNGEPHGTRRFATADRSERLLLLFSSLPDRSAGARCTAFSPIGKVRRPRLFVLPCLRRCQRHRAAGRQRGHRLSFPFHRRGVPGRRGHRPAELILRRELRPTARIVVQGTNYMPEQVHESPYVDPGHGGRVRQRSADHHQKITGRSNCSSTSTTRTWSTRTSW